MRNKRTKSIKETDERPINPINKNFNIKHREQLRKKLKNLLDKSKQSLHILSSDPKIVQSFCKTKNLKINAEKNVIANKKGPQTNKANATKPKNSKQNVTPVVSKKNSKNSTENNIMAVKIKRKSKDKPLKKKAKLFKCSSSFESTSSAKIETKQRNTPSSVRGTVRKKNIANKQIFNINNESKLSNKKRRKDNAKNQKELGSKQKTAEKSKIEITKKTPKRKKISVKPYTGPFRPDTPESVSNNKQALTLVAYENENTTDENYNDQDDDYYSVDYEYSSTDDYGSYSDDDESASEDYTISTDERFTYFSSDSDRTYELPKNVSEDVYVANGTAVKHDLSENNEVNFDSDTSTAQIIEIPTASSTQNVVTNNSIISTNKGGSNINHADNKDCESDDSCPELIPIDYKNHKDDDTDSDYCPNCWSSTDSDSDAESCCISGASECSEEPAQMTPEIFQADKAAKQDFYTDFIRAADGPPRNYIAGSPLDRIAIPKSNTSSYKVITTNNEIVIPNSEPEVISSNSVIKKKVIATRIEKVQSENLLSTVKNSVDTSTVSVTPVNKESVRTPKKTDDNLSFKTLFFNAVNSNQVIVLLKDPLYLYGTVKLKLFAGSLEIFGYNLQRNEILEVFSPRGYSSLKIEASKSSSMSTSANEKELLSLTPYFIRTDLEEIIEKFDPKKDAIVILERNDRSKKVNMLRKYMVEHLFPNMNSIQSDRPFYTSEFLLRCILTPRSDKALIVDPRWKTITVTNNSRVLVIGGKSVGKSSLVRYLINRNLNTYSKILLIDLDIGQPEMFVPQTVSATTVTIPLLGPGYFLNKEPDKAFLVGNSNIVLLPQRYIENVQALMEFCKANTEYRDIPWIVNTMGYNKGFGDELVAVICNLLHPTNIVQLQSNKEINNFDVIMSKENLESMEWNIIGDMLSSNAVFRPQHHLTLMNSVIPNDRKYQCEWDMNPRDMRLAMIVSRLSTILKGHAEWLTDIKPVCASIDDLKILNLGDEQINGKDLLQTLVGNLIYLCREESEEKSNECLGIGIVRGIDYPLKQIYLLPAVPLEVLKRVNCLAICGIPLPSSILINQGPKVRGVASYIYNTVDKAASMYIKQIFSRPQHFLTGRHKSFVE